ncbi:hypothetical protein BCR35DRAFT_352269 [Leucosporidium creatinivorum]|uniref:Zn(2)-C6 fungal-type domain-containing protein n=1 Tax=Leucosporidium creatinivorum TaxID=106004 RepID=A0A1Y2FCV3_9BASI|nr:hypothetical protein BCR35DRAFT_352269 [Leucosporidium creatinivorum]
MPPDTAPKSGRGGSRSSVACTRCRRYRTKCVRPTLTSVCEGCTNLGLASECRNPKRGEDQGHRAFRRRYPDEAALDGGEATASRPVVNAVNSSNNGPSSSEVEAACLVLARLGEAPVESSRSAVLPPMDQVKEALHAFRNSYFQLGFLPLALFVSQLEREPETVSLFLLLAILTASARFTPSLVQRFGSANAATDFYVKEARKLIGEEMLKPSLPACQAFFVLSAHHWGCHGGDEESAMLMGVATRMAGLLCLHEESTYALPPDATAGQVIHAEAARRTFWLIASQEDLTAGRRRHAPFSLENIDVLLPCDEDTLALGVLPRARASLRGTRPAIAEPSTIDLPSRSLFATMLQSNHAWGKVARLAVAAQTGKEIPPWCLNSDFDVLNRELNDWYKHLPPHHRWSTKNLLAMRALGHDLAFFEITVLHHLSGIVLRKTYLGCADGGRVAEVERFWTIFAREMIQGALDLVSVFDEFAATRSLTLGMPPILIFGVYVSGTVFGYLCRWPDLCWELAGQARPSLGRCLSILDLLKDIWPMASCWRDDLLELYSQEAGESGAGFRITAILEQMKNHFDGIYRHAPPSTSAEPLAQASWPSPLPSPSSTHRPSPPSTFPSGDALPRPTPAAQSRAPGAPEAVGQTLNQESAIAEYDPRAAGAGFPTLPARLGAEFNTPLEDDYLAFYSGAGFALDLGMSWDWRPSEEGEPSRAGGLGL